MILEKSRNWDRTPVDWMECHLCGERHLYRNTVDQGQTKVIWIWYVSDFFSVKNLKLTKLSNLPNSHKMRPKRHLTTTHWVLFLRKNIIFSGRNFESSQFFWNFGELYKRQDIREHVLTRHKDQRVYQCQRCEFLTDDLRETMVDHMIGEHDVRHPLCENVDFQEFFQNHFYDIFTGTFAHVDSAYAFKFRQLLVKEYL